MEETRNHKGIHQKTWQWKARFQEQSSMGDKKNSQNHASCKNFRIDQSVHTMFDYPKMLQVFKKVNLVKERDAVVQNHTLKAYLHFYLDAEDSFEDELDYYASVGVSGTSGLLCCTSWCFSNT